MAYLFVPDNYHYNCSKANAGCKGLITKYYIITQMALMVTWKHKVAHKKLHNFTLGLC